jgi:hypothetical protein
MKSKIEVEVEDEYKNRWAKEAIMYLNEHPEEYYTYRMSGDTMIIAMRPEGEGTIEVLDLRIRHRMLIDDALHKPTWEE